MSSSEKLTWAILEGYPRECARCHRPISRLVDIRQHGVKLDDKGRVVLRFLRCKGCRV